MITLALSFLLSAAAPETASPSASTTTAAKPSKPKKICRDANNTGSRIKKQVCRTQEEWDNQGADVRSDVRLGGASSN